jgi:exodeoxyribonuclease VII small subunit
MDKSINLSESLKKLTDIVSWFENEKDIDLEQGLIKVKEGAELIKVCKARLTKIENEFTEIQKEISDEDKS